MFNVHPQFPLQLDIMKNNEINISFGSRNQIAYAPIDISEKIMSESLFRNITFEFWHFR